MLILVDSHHYRIETNPRVNHNICWEVTFGEGGAGALRGDHSEAIDLKLTSKLTKFRMHISVESDWVQSGLMKGNFPDPKGRYSWPMLSHAINDRSVKLTDFSRKNSQ